MPSIGLDETITNNVNLTAPDFARGDLVTVITPHLRIDGEGTHTSLHGFVAAPIALYAKTGAENNYIYPSANLVGNLELYEKFFQVEAAINASQQFLNPFGPQPVSIASATDNRYTATSYRVSPYIQGTAPGEIKYQLRNDNTWTTLSGAPISTENAFYDVWSGSVEGPVRRFGWAVEGNWNEVKFNEQRPQISELARAKLIWQADPQLRFNAAGGYENNRFPFVTYKGPIYGGGFQWTPTERMNVVGNYEHRYFGSSYLFTFDNRTPLSAASISVSRNVTSYPQQLLTLPPTGNVAALLFFMFASRIPDPAARLAFVRAIHLGPRAARRAVERAADLHAADQPAGDRHRHLRAARRAQQHLPERVLAAPGADRRFRQSVAPVPVRLQQQYAIGRSADMVAQADAARLARCVADVAPDHREPADSRPRGFGEAEDRPGVRRSSRCRRRCRLTLRSTPARAIRSRAATRCPAPKPERATTRKSPASPESPTRSSERRDVRNLLPAHRQALPAQPRSVVLLRQPRATSARSRTSSTGSTRARASSSSPARSAPARRRSCGAFWSSSIPPRSSLSSS